MKIIRVKYVEEGYFEVKYRDCLPIVQDITSMKMTSPTDSAIREVLLFMRKLKLEKISNENFDDLKYRDQVVVDVNKQENDANRQKIEGLLGSSLTLPDSKF